MMLWILVVIMGLVASFSFTNYLLNRDKPVLTKLVWQERQM